MNRMLISPACVAVRSTRAARRLPLAGLVLGWAAALLSPWSLASTDVAAAEPPPGVERVEFVYETAPFPQCHASTIAESKDADGRSILVAAWFGGEYEKHPRVGIWIARRDANRWSAPVEVADGVQADGSRHPCWNPVLHQVADGPLWLFYKVGPSPSSWWGMAASSRDGGANWSKPIRLPEGIAGPIKNKPITLADGRLLCGSSTEDHGWRVHVEWTSDPAGKWSRTEPLNDGGEIGAIQPTLLKLADGGLKMLCRSRGVGKILAATSQDAGKTWSKLEPIELANPNSGIDAVTLRDGRHLLIYNHTSKGRTPLNLAMSADGAAWSAAAVLETEPGEYSYPAIIQTSDGKVHLTYTWKRTRVRHVVVDPTKLELKPL